MRKTFNLDDDLMADVKRVAKQKRTTQTAVIHQALTSYINGFDMALSMQPLLQEMMDNIVSKHKGTKDNGKT